MISRLFTCLFYTILSLFQSPQVLNFSSYVGSGKVADTQVRPYKGTGKEMAGAVPSPPLLPPALARLSGGNDWQADGAGGAAVHVALDGDLALMLGNEAPADGQPQTGAPLFGG